MRRGSATLNEVNEDLFLNPERPAWLAAHTANSGSRARPHVGVILGCDVRAHWFLEPNFFRALINQETHGISVPSGPYFFQEVTQSEAATAHAPVMRPKSH